uniref:Uncharacterized protein n=1 Tax=Quercus lobata TaxID=97700 RepID=A0A7N2L2U7_QUELO
MFQIRASVVSWNFKRGISSIPFWKSKFRAHFLEATLNITPASRSCVAEYLGKDIEILCGRDRATGVGAQYMDDAVEVMTKEGEK